MSNPGKTYKDYIYNNLPSGMTYDEAISRFVVNGKRFFSYWEAKKHLDYLDPHFLEISSYGPNFYDTTENTSTGETKFLAYFDGVISSDAPDAAFVTTLGGSQAIVRIDTSTSGLEVGVGDSAGGILTAGSSNRLPNAYTTGKRFQYLFSVDLVSGEANIFLNGSTTPDWTETWTPRGNTFSSNREPEIFARGFDGANQLVATAYVCKVWLGESTSVGAIPSSTPTVALPVTPQVANTLTSRQGKWANDSSSIDISSLFSGKSDGLQIDAFRSRTDASYDFPSSVDTSYIGGAVAWVEDLSGFNNHVRHTTSATASRGILRNYNSGNYRYLDFDGSDDYLEVPFSFVADQEYTIGFSYIDFSSNHPSQIMPLHRTNAYFGAGKDGDTAGQVSTSASATMDSLYVDNVPVSVATRDSVYQGYNSGSAAIMAMTSTLDLSDWRLGDSASYAGWESFLHLGKFVVIPGQLNSVERSLLNNYLLEGL